MKVKRKPLSPEKKAKREERRKKRFSGLVESRLPEGPFSLSKPMGEYSGKDLGAINAVLRMHNTFATPRVLDEWKTLERVLNGVSLARYGDGEVKHMDGQRNVSQVWSQDLQVSLKEAFHFRATDYMVGIPNVFDGRQFTEVNEGYIWSMRRRFWRIADLKYQYGSSYITRGDLFPAMHYPSYWSVMSELWNGRDVVLVRGHEKRANPEGMMAKARSIERIETPPKNAWEKHNALLKECLAHPKESIYLLCVGPTATVLAMELCKVGRWAVDLGHLGMFYRRFGIEDLTYRQVWNHRPGDPGYIKGVTDQC